MRADAAVAVKGRGCGLMLPLAVTIAEQSRFVHKRKLFMHKTVFLR